MLLFTVLLLATSALAAPGLLPTTRDRQNRQLAFAGRHAAVHSPKSFGHFPKPVVDVDQVPIEHVLTKSTHAVVVPTVAVQARHHFPGHEGFKSSDDHHVYEGARIVQQDTEVSPDGSFRNVWNSDNGISVQESGNLKRVGDVDVAVQQGVISYVDNEGNQFNLNYVADENGFHAEGAHLPTPPPIPEAIIRSLQYIAKHPYVEATTVSSHFHPIVVDN